MGMETIERLKSVLEISQNFNSISMEILNIVSEKPQDLNWVSRGCAANNDEYYSCIMGGKVYTIIKIGRSLSDYYYKYKFSVESPTEGRISETVYIIPTKDQNNQNDIIELYNKIAKKY
ncbi:MAG: hypothetical protein KGJ58_03685 [Patescibacteria group bacterium]|nr:hypothetical protein [Patescibacteria group bacterium]MDE1988460.1 hypothetical protein [Patescibacteria group bacterium]MDE2218524.1 hypothetical protein [Patescibacteria group bacterium]